MKTRMMLLMISVMAVSTAAFAQNSVKLFDAANTEVSDLSQTGYGTEIAFATKQVYLRCVSGAADVATLSGPGESNFLVDNFVRIDSSGGTSDVCPDYQVYGCFTPKAGFDPMNFLGQPVTNSLDAIAPLPISSVLAGTGLYTFKLMDYSYTYGNTEVWLNTSCSLVSQICHRNNGSTGQKTLNVGASAVPAHLAHGDTLGPCSQ